MVLRTLEERRRLRDKYPDRLPVIVEAGNSRDIPIIDKNKYLVPEDLQVGQFLYVIRKRINLPSEKALFLMCNNKMPTTSTTMLQLYETDKDEFGFINFVYTLENAFGK